MSTISLLTDFGDKDNFTGLVKAVIAKINACAKIIDLCHKIQPQAIDQAAFLLKHSFAYFPKKTIHLVVVDPGVGSKRKIILVKTKDYFFLAPDNGILWPTLKKQKIEKIIAVTNSDFFLNPVSDTFAGRDAFAPVAAHLSLGIEMQKFGKKMSKIKKMNLPRPRKIEEELIGKILYTDHFGNLITNIDKNTFFNFTKNYSFKIHFSGKMIDKISHNYLKKNKNTLKAIFGSFGNVEIALAEGSAEKFLSAKKDAVVRITRR